MAKIEQTGRGKSVESKLDAEPESNHFAILQELVRDRLQNLMRPNVRGGSKAPLRDCPPMTQSELGSEDVKVARPLSRATTRLFRRTEGAHTAPAFCAYSQEAFDSGTVRLADSMAFALAAVPSRIRPAMPCVIPASRNRL